MHQATVTAPQRSQPTQAMLPTNLTTHRHAIHRWYNFIAGFSPEYVHRCIGLSGLEPGARLIDPFSGLATALVEANRMGLDAEGYEAHPFFADIAEAKIGTRSLSQLDEVSTLLFSAPYHSKPVESYWHGSQLEFLSKLLDVTSLQRLGAARDRITDCSAEAKPLFQLVLSRTLEACAGAATDGIYKAPTTAKLAVPYQVALRTITDQIYEDLFAQDFSSFGHSDIWQQSSENMIFTDDSSIDICVTSPPYLNNFDYAEMTRMELYFWGYADSWRSITEKVRSKLIVNTTTAPTRLKNDQARWAGFLSPSMNDTLTALADQLADERIRRHGSKDYFKLVLPYFAQMSTVIQEAARVLKFGAPLFMVVADAALYGVHIHTESLIARLLEEAGFSVRRITRLRDRGDRWVLDKRTGPPGKLGEFEIEAVQMSETR